MNRLDKKRVAREAQSERQQLVHAAGCVHPSCSSKWFLTYPEWARDETIVAQGVRVPRSIRPILGLHTGDRP